MMPVIRLPLTKKQARILKNVDHCLRDAILFEASLGIIRIYEESNDGIEGHGIMSRGIAFLIDTDTERKLNNLRGKYLGKSFVAASVHAIQKAIDSRLNGGKK